MSGNGVSTDEAKAKQLLNRACDRMDEAGCKALLRMVCSHLQTPTHGLLVVALGSAALVQGCAHGMSAERVCADFHAHAGDAAFSIGTTDQLDVAPLVERLEPGQVVAVGEGTHGTHEYRRFQTLVMKSLVEDLGYTGVAIEGVGVEALWINDYICEGKAPFSPIFLGTAEYYDAIEWLRTHNQERGPEDCVKLIPFDPFDGGRAAIVYVKTTLDRENIDLGVDDERAICLREWVDPGADRSNPCRASAAESLERVLAGLGPERADLREAARFARDSAVVAEAEGFDPARDYFMASNIIAALDEHPKGFVIWAHDGHISEGPIDPHMNGGNGDNTMGHFLSRHLGHRYVSIAQLSRRGTASLDSRNGGTRESNFAAKPGYLERLVGDADMGVDLRDLVPGNPAWACAMMEHRMMWLGGYHVPGLTNGGQPIVPGASFDVLVIMTETSKAESAKGTFLGKTD